MTDKSRTEREICDFLATEKVFKVIRKYNNTGREMKGEKRPSVQNTHLDLK